LQQTPLYIVASPHPRVGKTLLARLLLEFFHSEKRPLLGYDLNPREPTFAGYFPRWVFTVDIADTRGQMELFDRLIADKPVSTVIDLGYGAFEQFFSVLGEIGFANEARRRGIETVVLFVSDRAPATVRAYGTLRRKLANVAFIPVHNESVSVTIDKDDFPPSRPEFRIISIPRLSPIVKGVVDRPSFSFASYLVKPSTGPTEIHDWVATIFNAFRDLELRLMMGRVTSVLGGVSLGPPPLPRGTSRR
jgi:hypothetical protein